jgi:hypothetical protein
LLDILARLVEVLRVEVPVVGVAATDGPGAHHQSDVAAFGRLVVAGEEQVPRIFGAQVEVIAPCVE